MKSKDIIYLALALAILMLAGFIAYTQLFPPPASEKDGVDVEVVGKIKPDFDVAAMSTLIDSSRTQDFTVPLPLEGLGNQAPFGR